MNWFQRHSCSILSDFKFRTVTDTLDVLFKSRTQAGVGVHCRRSQVITEYMENTLPTDVDIWSIDRFVIFFAFVDYVYCILAVI